MIIITFLAFLVGFLLFHHLGPTVNPIYSDYLALAIVAGADAILGGVRSRLEGNYNETIFISSFFIKMILAPAVAFAGAQLGLPFYFAVLVALGINIYNNLGRIQGLLVTHSVEHRHPHPAPPSRNASQ